jgi:hypothetical protein
LNLMSLIGLIISFDSQELAVFEKFPDQVRINGESRLNKNLYF